MAIQGSLLTGIEKLDLIKAHIVDNILVKNAVKTTLFLHSAHFCSSDVIMSRPSF